VWLAWESDDFEAAYKQFRDILDRHPEFADVHNKAGLCLAMMGEMDRALDQFDEALSLNATYAEAHLNRAIVLNDLGRFEEASESFHKASQLDTKDSTEFPSDLGNQLADSHARSGDLYLDVDRLDDARDHLEAILEMSPRFLDARVRLGALLHRLGDLAGARKEWILCAEEDPEDRRVQAYLAALDS
jgi:tetratricopeptide (TPR) repeat protein